MNERIRELVRESNLDMYGVGKERHRWEYTVEKFAELIVRECVQVCADRGAHHDGLYSAWADDCSKRIGKHFGVEE